MPKNQRGYKQERLENVATNWAGSIQKKGKELVKNVWKSSKELGKNYVSKEAWK